MAGEPAQHAAAHLRLDHGNVFRHRCRGLSELGPTGFERLEHAVEDAVVEVSVQCGPEAVGEARTPKRACAEAPGQLFRSWASTTRGKRCRTAVTALGSRSGCQRSRLDTNNTHWRAGRGGKT